MAYCPHSSLEIGIFLPWGLDLYKLGLFFSMCRFNVLISEHFLGEEAKTLCGRLDLNAWFYSKLWLKSWLGSERYFSIFMASSPFFSHFCLLGFSGVWLVSYKRPGRRWNWGDTQQGVVSAADQHKGGQKSTVYYLIMAYRIWNLFHKHYKNQLWLGN